MREVSSQTLVAAIAAACARWPERPALRQKRRGIWVELSYGDLAERMRRLAHGLAGLGVGAGRTVILASENSLDAAVVDLAVQLLGAATLHVPPRLPPDRLASVLAESRAAIAICGDQEQIDAILAANQGHVATVVSIRQAGKAPAGIELLDLASLESRQDGGELPALLGSRSADETARRWVAAASHEGFELVSHTSRELLGRATEFIRATTLADGDRLMSIVSLARPAAALVDLYAPLLAGATVHFPESPATVAEDLAEVRPTLLHTNGRGLALLRIGESLAASETGSLRRHLLRWARGRLESGGTGLGSSIAYGAVGHWTARRLGLGSCRLAVVSDGGCSDKDRRFVAALRLPLALIGGTTADPGSLLSGAEAGMTSDREPAVRVEDAAIDSPYVRWAMLGEGSHGKTLSIQIEFEPVARRALADGLSFSSYASLVRLDAVRAMIAGEVEQALRARVPDAAPPSVLLVEREYEETTGELGADLLPRRVKPASAA